MQKKIEINNHKYKNSGHGLQKKRILLIII